MSQFDNIKFTGNICVTVDEVDLEQIAINRPEIQIVHPLIKAVHAAKEAPSFKAISRVLSNAGYTLIPYQWRLVSQGKYEVDFFSKEEDLEEEGKA